MAESPRIVFIAWITTWMGFPFVAAANMGRFEVALLASGCALFFGATLSWLLAKPHGRDAPWPVVSTLTVAALYWLGGLGLGIATASASCAIALNK